MTTPKKDGQIYIWLMGFQITIMLAFMAMVWDYSKDLNSYIRVNSIEHNSFYKALSKDSTWTRWVHRNQIIPAYEISFDNQDNICMIKDKLHSIDSNLIVSNSNIRRIFLYLRKDRDGKQALAD